MGTLGARVGFKRVFPDPEVQVRIHTVRTAIAAGVIALAVLPLCLLAQNPVSWAPDGDSVAVGTTIDGSSGIYVIAANGPGHRLLVAIDEMRMHPPYPAWSPDGKWIAYSDARTGNAEIYRIASGGGNPVRLTHDDSAGDSYPAWSRDGARLAFMSNRGGNWDIYVMNPDGSNQTRVTHSSGNDWNPSWSPDGTRLVYETNRHGGGQDELHVIDLVSGEDTRITDSPENDIFPDWAPAGSAVAYCTVANRHAVVDVIDLAGGASRLVVDDACLPRWSPDGKRLAFSRGGRILVMDVASGDVTEVTP